MAGHSHWKGIKYKKEAADAQKSKIFSKLARAISIAAREGGRDPETNPKLRTVIEQAREYNMPTENIERAIKRGIGELEGASLEEIMLEAYGPGGITIIIEGITDNKNRTLNEIKQILSKYNGKLVAEGSTKWMFDRVGIITMNVEGRNKEEIELEVIDAGAQDIMWINNVLEVYSKPEELYQIKSRLEEKGFKIENAVLGWKAKEYKQVDPKDKSELEKLFLALDENEAVQEIYSNVKIK